jgi:hypothetical protein
MLSHASSFIYYAFIYSSPLAKRVKIKENDPDSDVALLMCQRHIISSPEFFASFFFVAKDRRNRPRSLIHLWSSSPREAHHRLTWNRGIVDNERINWLETNSRLFLWCREHTSKRTPPIFLALGRQSRVDELSIRGVSRALARSFFWPVPYDFLYKES